VLGLADSLGEFVLADSQRRFFGEGLQSSHALLVLANVGIEVDGDAVFVQLRLYGIPLLDDLVAQFGIHQGIAAPLLDLCLELGDLGFGFLQALGRDPHQAGLVLQLSAPLRVHGSRFGALGCLRQQLEQVCDDLRRQWVAGLRGVGRERAGHLQHLLVATEGNGAVGGHVSGPPPRARLRRATRR
jgi:hypothetical protein